MSIWNKQIEDQLVLRLVWVTGTELTVVGAYETGETDVVPWTAPVLKVGAV